MPLELHDISRLGFTTSRSADLLNSELQKCLGLPTRYAPARIAIALSLERDLPASAFQDSPEDQGKAIKGNTLFGDSHNLMTWIALLVESARPSQVTDKETLRRLVSFHWERGLGLLKRQLDECEGDFDRLIYALLDAVDLSAAPHAPTPGSVMPPDCTDVARVSLRLGTPGTDVKSGQEVHWSVNGPGYPPHVAIVGGSGTGKTRLANDLVAQIKKQSPQTAIVVFDMGKGDLAANVELREAIEATVVTLPREPLPLDILGRRDAITETEAIDKSRRVRDSIVKASSARLGPNQQSRISEVVKQAFREKPRTTLADIRDAALQLYEERGESPDSLVALLNDVTEYALFDQSQSPAQFFSRSWIIDLHTADETTQRLVTFLVLDALDTWFTQLNDSAMDTAGYRSLRVVCMVDEARKVLNLGHSSLLNLVRTCRSKGGSLLFMTQSPEDLLTDKENYLDQMGLVVSFRVTGAAPKALEAAFGSRSDLGSLEDGVFTTRIPGNKKPSLIRGWSR